jgi:hypothetical protein
MINTDFGAKMRRRVRDDWQKFNLDYDQLNNRLIIVKAEFGMRKAVSSRSLTGETRTFSEILDMEVEKVVLFYLKTQGELASNLYGLRKEQASLVADLSLSLKSIEILCNKYRSLGNEVLQLLDYLDVNVIGLRRILKIHDRQFDLKMTNIYFDSRLGSMKSAGNASGSSALSSGKGYGHSPLLQLYHQEGLRAIIGTIKRAFEELYEAKAAIIEANSSILELTGPDCDASPDQEYIIYQGPSTGFESDKAVNHHKLPKVAYLSRIASASKLSNLLPAGVGSRDNSNSYKDKNNSYTSSSWLSRSINFIAGNSHEYSKLPAEVVGNSAMRRNISVTELEPIVKYINDAANRVMKNQSITISEYLSSHSHMGLEMKIRDMQRGDDEDLFDDLEGDKELSGQFPRKDSDNTSLYLTLFITFLYQANQYVVGPTSGDYAKRLGESNAMSGLIIGLSPLAALVSAVVFSAWTNHSFKRPLVVSLLFLVFGNLFYAVALQFKSVTLIFIGRMMTGLGAPRGICRRYIADHVSVESRTQASSNFVTAGALGLAIGPLISSIVVYSQYYANVTFNGVLIFECDYVNAPGYIMFLLFWISLILVVFFFKEPVTVHSLLQSTSLARKEQPKPARSGMSNSGDNELHRLGSLTHSSSYGSVGMVQHVISVEMGDILQSDYDPVSSKDATPSTSIYKGDLGLARDSGARDSYSPAPETVSMKGTNEYFNSQVFTQQIKLVRETTRYCWQNISIEVGIILYMYFVNKTGQEMLVSSIPTLAGNIGITAIFSGYFMAIMGAVVLPANVFVSSLMRDCEDRTVMMRLSYLSLFFLFILFHTGLLEYTVVQYVIGAISLFACLNALEGIIMSLLSKLVSPELAKGTFNSGLLATEAGTFGRVIGDLAITVTAVSIETSNHIESSVALINYLFVPIALGTVVSILIIHYYYDKFEV